MDIVFVIMNLDLVEDTKSNLIRRRFIAEDYLFNKDRIDTLKESCLKFVVENFECKIA